MSKVKLWRGLAMRRRPPTVHRLDVHLLCAVSSRTRAGSRWLRNPGVRDLGLREIGEPARKALIVSLLSPAVRAQGVGLYWGIRGIAICWASLVGALIWFVLGPDPLLYFACAFGCVGAAVFYVSVRAPGEATDTASIEASAPGS